MHAVRTCRTCEIAAFPRMSAHADSAVCRSGLGRRAERAGRWRLFCHPARSHPQRPRCEGGEHCLDARIVSRTGHDRLGGTPFCERRERASVSGLGAHQPCRRRGRGDPVDLDTFEFFAHLVPWLVLFATGLFAYGSFGPRARLQSRALDPRVAGTIQFFIAIYGGYFGGGIGFLMLAALTAAGLAVRVAGATKNVLASVMNAAAVAIFVFTPNIPWLRVGVVCVGAMAGGYVGALTPARRRKTHPRICRRCSGWP